MEQIASWGSLTTIEVYANNNGNNVRILGDSGSSASSKSGEPSYITDEVIADFQKIPYVTGVSPVLEMNVLMRQGAYEAQYIRLTGVSQSYLKQLDLGEGRIPGLRGNGNGLWKWSFAEFYECKNRKRLLGHRRIAGCGSDGKAGLCCF